MTYSKNHFMEDTRSFRQRRGDDREIESIKERIRDLRSGGDRRATNVHDQIHILEKELERLTGHKVQRRLQ